MPEPTKTTSTPETQENETTLHICKCGEVHEHIEGKSHRESCTSPKKFGDSCCASETSDMRDHPCCAGRRRCH